MNTTKSNSLSRSKVKQGLLSVYVMLFGVVGAVTAVTNTGFYAFAGWAAVFIAAIWLFRLAQKEMDKTEEDNGKLATYLPISGGILVMLTAIAGTAGYLN